MSILAYKYKIGGREQIDYLPYNPLESGFEIVNEINCCIHFKRGKYLLKAKKATKILIIEERGKSRPINKGLLVPTSQESFKQILHRHGISS